MGYRTCHFSSLGVQGFLAEVAMGTTEIFKCPKKSEKISMRRLMLKLRDDPELAINGIIRYCKIAGPDDAVRA